MFHGKIFLSLVRLNLLMNFVSGFRLELMYISIIISIRSSLTHLHSFQLLELLPEFIEITFFCLYQQNKSSESKGKLRQELTLSSVVLSKINMGNFLGFFYYLVNYEKVYILFFLHLEKVYLL